MSGDTIKYRKGYKYQLAETYSLWTDFFEYTAYTQFIYLEKGLLTMLSGYAWDGCSGPTIDDHTNMRGGLVHDGTYQLIRLGYLPERCKASADKRLETMCIEDGMYHIRAHIYFEGVDHFAGFAAKYGNEPYPILTAP